MTAAALEITEAAWQEQVVELARMCGWRCCHTRRSIGKGTRWTTATSVVGWPDLVMWSTRHKRVIFVELKSESGKVSSEQARVHAELTAAGADVFVWRPSDLDEAQAVLQGRRRDP